MSDLSKPALFVRPANANAELPMYAPERDFSLQGVRILGEIEGLLAGDRAEEFLGVYAEMGGETDRCMALIAINSAGLALAEFIADAQGYTYTGVVSSEWPVASKAVSFKDAMAKLDNHANPAAVRFLLFLSGRFALDAFFYGERMRSQMGQVMHDDFNRYMDYLSMAMRAGIAKQEERPFLTREFTRLIRVLVDKGWSESTINQIVSKTIAEELTK